MLRHGAEKLQPHLVRKTKLDDFQRKAARRVETARGR